MKKYNSLLLFVLSFVFFSCDSQNKKNMANNVPLESNQPYASQWFSSLDIEKLAKCSKEFIDIMYKKNDTLDIGSGGNLIYKPFGFEMDSLLISSIQIKHGNIFHETIERIEIDETGEEKLRIVLLEYKNSFVKCVLYGDSFFPSNAKELAEYHYQEPEKVRIVFAKISDPDIMLIYDIKIGLSKSDFFKKIFADCSTSAIKDVNIIYNEDMLGDYLKQTFIFKNERLVNVIME